MKKKLKKKIAAEAPIDELFDYRYTPWDDIRQNTPIFPRTPTQQRKVMMDWQDGYFCYVRVIKRAASIYIGLNRPGEEVVYFDIRDCYRTKKEKDGTKS